MASHTAGAPHVRDTVSAHSADVLSSLMFFVLLLFAALLLFAVILLFFLFSALSEDELELSEDEFELEEVELSSSESEMSTVLLPLAFQFLELCKKEWVA